MSLSIPKFPSFPSKFLLALLFLVNFVNCQFHDASEEQAVLLKLKTYWQNPVSIKHWVPSVNSFSHCNWPEITCINNSVIELQLSNKTIGRTIPSFICDLKNLKLIDLNYNDFHGEFPTTVFNCSKLESLDLSQNYFVGSLPEDIDRLRQLQFLKLGSNNFSGQIPASIGLLQGLRHLDLVLNHFNGSVPVEIGNLSKLEYLSLAFNDKFLPSILPSCFKQLKKLKTLWMSETNLIGEIPDIIGDMEALEVLDLSQNKLTGKIPDVLFLLMNLEVIYLYENKLSGQIPQVIKSSNLTMIDLSENNLTGTILSDIGKLENLSGLVLFFNQLSGEIPESIGKISTLTDVRLFSNNLSGTLPPDFGRYSMLDRFEVASNNFTGNLPEDLCNVGKLRGLVAFDNNFNGELPKSLDNCNSLEMVRLHNNGLTGSIPDGLWTSSNLSMLMISDNIFTGELPKKVSTSLSRIEISNNKFFGQIPVEVSSWRNLVVFKASNNLFNGTIPKALTALPFLTTLFLDQNQFHGSLPSTIISWKSLVALNLGQNKLSGQIPEALCFLPNLQVLDLSRNQFSGLIPQKLGLLSRITSLNLCSNLLIGNIPKQFENAAFSDSFLHNIGLCSTSPYINLETCPSPKRSGSARLNPVWISITVLIGVFVLILALSFLMIKFCPKRKLHALDLRWELITFFQNLNITELDILPGLIEKNKIGSGVSGNVYRVDLTCSKDVDVVAAKVIWNNRKLEETLERHFEAEVGILGTIRHLNIVKLLCYLSSETSKVLVYEYLENRSLDLWLHKNRATTVSCSSRHDFTLDWPKRLQIAIGAAQGLCYMHHDCSPPIIHRDVKSSNILLDSKFNAKIADFGLAKMSIKKGEEPITVSHVAGSFGYMAPEYAQTARINEKIDVYSFGVVLLELTTGKEASNGDGNRSLAEWAQRHFQENSIVDALDEEINDACYLNQMCNVFKIGIHCTRTLPSDRPCMRKVVQMLLQCGQSRNCEKNLRFEDLKNGKTWETNGVELV